jgi:hypothetical protein
MSDTERSWFELRSAVFAGDYKAAEVLLRKYPGLLKLRNGIGETVLHYMAVENATEGVAWLHGKGADLDTKNKFGTPVLFEVAQLGYKDLFAWFVKRGVNIWAVDEYDQGLVAFLTEFHRTDMARTALRTEIEVAFAGVARDPEQSLHQSQLTDQGMSRQILGREWREAGRRDRERSWTEVPGEALDECDAALSHFTLDSWRFYLPAYLCRALSLFAAPDYETELLDIVVFQLTCRKDADHGMRSYLLERYQSLTPAQHAAVRHFLEFVVQESLHLVETTNDHYRIYDDARTALESYWADGNSDRE